MKELTNGQAGAAEVTVAPGSLLEAITRVAADPRTNIDAMERLFAMQMQLLELQRKQAFAEAMNRLQTVLPQITQAGVQYNKPKVEGGKTLPPTVRNRYPLIEDIDLEIRPLYTAEGFSVFFTETKSTGNTREFAMTVEHRDGFSRTMTKTMPLDSSDFRTACQSESSTVSLARRILLTMQFNLVKRGVDDDGQGGAQPITEDQVGDLHSLIDEVTSAMKRADPTVTPERVRSGFLKMMGVARVEDILSSDHKKAVQALEERRRNLK